MAEDCSNLAPKPIGQQNLVGDQGNSLPLCFPRYFYKVGSKPIGGPGFFSDESSIQFVAKPLYS